MDKPSQRTQVILAAIVFVALFLYSSINYLLEKPLDDFIIFWYFTLLSFIFLALFLFLPAFFIDVLAEFSSDKELSRMAKKFEWFTKGPLAKLLALVLIYFAISVIASVYLIPTVAKWMTTDNVVELWQARFYLQMIIMSMVLLIRIASKLNLKHVIGGVSGFLIGTIVLSLLSGLVEGYSGLDSLPKFQSQLIFLFFVLVDYTLLETPLFERVKAVKNKIYGTTE